MRPKKKILVICSHPAYGRRMQFILETRMRCRVTLADDLHNPEWSALHGERTFDLAIVEALRSAEHVMKRDAPDLPFFSFTLAWTPICEDAMSRNLVPCALNQTKAFIDKVRTGLRRKSGPKRKRAVAA